ncbi:amidase [Ensifer sp. Root142]|uniref:amidase n=1 Tax=Ensifer sp. Root142 TaxID=1736461 RepID=UPI000AFB33CB|nr:amidase [Ensifer sp. Root142]MDP9632706.1 amidase [Ensifer adhaerens]
MTETPMQPQNSALSQTFRIGGDGLTVVIKECLSIRGLVTRCGCRALACGPSSSSNADVVDALIDNGCAIIGTANMHELAFGVTGVNDYLGTPLNPRWPDRIPGGSSSGSASLVAAGACDFAVGTDTGGSVRVPACCTGIFGMKPTYGRISRTGAIPAESSIDCIGPLAPTAAMLTRSMECMDPSFKRQDAAGPFRLVAVTVAASQEVQAAFDAALEGLVAASTPLEGLARAYQAGLVVINAEMARAFGDLARASEGLDPEVRSRILAAVDSFDSAALERAEEVRTLFQQEVDAALAHADALVLPTMPVVPPRLAEAGDMQALIPLTVLARPFNLSGHPAVTVPIRTAGGLPAGVQLIGRRGEDETLCAVTEWVAQQLKINGDPL